MGVVGDRGETRVSNGFILPIADAFGVSRSFELFIVPGDVGQSFMLSIDREDLREPGEGWDGSMAVSVSAIRGVTGK